MPIQVTADPLRFDEASKWFRARVPMTDRAFKKTRDQNHDRAFTIANVQQMRVVETVHKELDRAIREGLPIDEFRRRIKKKLGDKHGISGSHMDTVFRNAVQGAYNTGRWYQLTDPDVVTLRPYFVLDVVLDTRTSDICRPVAKTCKPHDDPWWLSNWPPRHHRCRAGVRSVRKKEAERIGITKRTPKGESAAGFGKAPPVRGSDADEPELDDVPEPVKRIYKRKAAAKQPRRESTPQKPAKRASKSATKKTATKKRRG